LTAGIDLLKNGGKPKDWVWAKTKIFQGAGKMMSITDEYMIDLHCAKRYINA